MANTEKITVLQAVRNAKKQVMEARRDPSLKKDEQGVLEKSYNALEAAEDDIIIDDIEDCIRALKADTEKLKAISSDIKKKIAKLASLADDVKKAANAIKTLVDILSKAGTLGS